MLKCHNYDIVCSEIPDEVTLAINIAGCPNHCEGCHSPWLWEDAGEPLDEELMAGLLERYGSSVTCVCFMGGDCDPSGVERLARWLRANSPRLKVGWYTGQERNPAEFTWLDYLKTGPYIAALGDLRSPTTNQRLYRITPDGAEVISLVR